MYTIIFDIRFKYYQYIRWARLRFNPNRIKVGDKFTLHDTDTVLTCVEVDYMNDTITGHNGETGSFAHCGPKKIR